MPAERDQHNAFGQPTGLWPGQDVPRQQGGGALPWPEAAPPVPPAEARPGLPWPESGPGAGHADPDPRWAGADRGYAGPPRQAGPPGHPDAPGDGGWAQGTDDDWTAHGGPDDWAPQGADAGWAPQGDDAGWGPHAGGAGGWTPQDGPAGPMPQAGPGGWGPPAGPGPEAGWAEGAPTATATLPGPPPDGVRAEPRVRPGAGGADQPPPPPVAPTPTPPGGSRRRWRVALATALVLAVAGGGVAVATLRPDETPQAGGTPRTGGPAQSAGPSAATSPGAATPSAEQGLGGKPSVSPSTSAGSVPGFAGTRLTLPGASIGVQNGETFGQALSRSDRTFGKLRMARVFFPGLPPAWNGSRADVVDRTVVVSFKASPQEINSGKYDSRLASWFASIPRDHNVYWSYFHEPEDDVERGAFTTAAYRTAWKRVAGLANRANNPKLINTLILMCWTLDPKSGRSFDSFYPGGDVIETLGWDCYNWGAKWKRYASPQEIYGEMISKSKALGKPWGVAETGSDLVPGDSGSGRANWIRSMTGYLNGQRPEFVAYYNQVVSQGDFRLLDQPSIQAWKSFCVA
ncbi:hypothetical protein ACFFMM_10110 [Micromonospora chaiyaphumensis]|uniref:GH26 domain-containing protein n=1 Tax=Micromonospora chaiyaphumensis TaxID=307119 RepID=A0A1C4XW32_9ACTN|nr:hypothetical protein [Micromonospora chaiyaphumensis]SCF12708.1 hypothetical protein GA0070214_106436 [Micromonospora chaiyaphumensis]